MAPKSVKRYTQHQTNTTPGSSLLIHHPLQISSPNPHTLSFKPNMCQFVWKDSECASCGLFFDRRLTACRNPRARRGKTCSKVHLRENEPNFKCQECLVSEKPWKRLRAQEDVDGAEYYSDDSKDSDYDSSGTESDEGDSDDEGDFEIRHRECGIKNKAEDASWDGAGRRRNPKRQCTSVGRVALCN